MSVAHPPIASTTLDLVDRSRASLLSACQATDTAERYVEAHLSALRAAAALIAARSTRSRPSRPRSVWDVLPSIAPELTEWAIFYAASATRRAVIERGGHHVPARDADDLLRQSEIFLDIITEALGIPRPRPLPDYLAPAAVGPSRMERRGA